MLRALAVLAPESCSGEKEFLGDALENLGGNCIKPVIARCVPPGFKRDELWLPGLHEIDELERLGRSLIELLESVAVDRKLQRLIRIFGVDRLSRSLKLCNDIVGFDQVDDAFKVDERLISVPGLDQRHRERNFRALGSLWWLPAVKRQHFLGHDRKLHLFVAVFVADFGFRPLVVPVGVEDSTELFKRHSAVGLGFFMKPG